MLDSMSKTPTVHGSRLFKGDGIAKTREKRVRFSSHLFVKHTEEFGNDVANQSKSNAVSAANTHVNTWWSPDEMTEFRHAAKLSSREVSRNVWMLDAFEEAHRIARQLAASQEDEAALLETLRNPILHISPELVSWCRYGHSRRGLERWSSKFHNAARSEAVKRARRKLLDDMNETDPESVRVVYERLTRGSKIFARFMGQADATATEPLVAEKSKRPSPCHDPSSSKTSALVGSPAPDVKISCRLRINRQ